MGNIEHNFLRTKLSHKYSDAENALSVLTDEQQTRCGLKQSMTDTRRRAETEGGRRPHTHTCSAAAPALRLGSRDADSSGHPY